MNSYGNGLLPGAAFETTKNSYINIEVFLKWPQHSREKRDPEKSLPNFDGNSKRSK
jgi:hypothetical protein